MKKIKKIILICILSFITILGFENTVYAASASLTGPSVVRAGDTITLNLNISDDGKLGIEGKIDYDASKLSLSDVSFTKSGWSGQRNGNYFYLMDTTQTQPLSGKTAVVSLKFKVNSNVTVGDSINVSVSELVSSDGSAESSIGTASYSATIAAPLSSNANLSSLSVSEGTLSPSFSAGTTSYKIPDVEYSVSKLNITYKTEDTKSTVSISGNSLAVGANTVSVTVKAENGTTKTYKISVTRKQDPNYVASSNATLGGITISAGSISPGFSSEVNDYIVYLPYEYVGKDFSVAGTAADAKALGVTGGTISPLVEGVNSTSVVCKAEDGTEKTYKITVVVMPQYNGAVPNIEGVDAPEPEVEDTETEFDTEDDIHITENDNDNGIAGAIAIVVIILLIGALIYVLFFLNKRNRM